MEVTSRAVPAGAAATRNDDALRQGAGEERMAAAAARTGVHTLVQSRIDAFLRRNNSRADSDTDNDVVEVSDDDSEGRASCTPSDEAGSGLHAVTPVPSSLPAVRSAVPWLASLTCCLLSPGVSVNAPGAPAAQLTHRRLCSLRPAPLQFERLTPSDRRPGAPPRPITAMAFDRLGSFLAVAASGGDGLRGPSIKLYDAEDVFAATALARAAGAQGSAVVLEGLPEVPLLHAVETGSSPIVAMAWNPGRPGQLASISRGAGMVSYWDMDAAPCVPTGTYSRDRDGMVPVPGALAGMSCVSFVYDVNTPSPQPQGPAGAGGGGGGGAAATPPSPSFSWYDVTEGAPARPKAGVLAPGSSGGRHALSPRVTGSPPAAAASGGCSGHFFVGGDGAGRVRLWDVRVRGGAPVWAVDARDCMPEGLRARPVPPGGRSRPGGVAERLLTTRPSGALATETDAEAFSLRHGGLQPGTTPDTMRGDWGLSELEVLALVQGGAAGTTITAAMAGGAVMGWDMRAVAKRGMVARASPAVLTAWDAAAAVKAAATATPALRHPAPAASAAWPFVPTSTVVAPNGTTTQVPVRIRTALPHPASAGWVTVTWSNSWVSVHEVGSGSLVRVHRPTEKEEGVTVVGKRVTCEVGGSATGAAAGGGGCGAFIPGVASPLLALPQLRALAPPEGTAPLPGYAGRTHYRGSLGEPVLASTNPLEPTAVLSFVDLSRPGAHPDDVVASLVMPSPLSAIAPHPAAVDHLVVGTSDGQVLLLACDPRAFE